MEPFFSVIISAMFLGEVSYMILQRVSPVTHFVGNCVKRVVVIVSSVLFVCSPVSPFNSLAKKVFANNKFLMRMTKDEGETNLASGKAKPEFSEWKWASTKEAVANFLCRQIISIMKDYVCFEPLHIHGKTDQQVVDYKRPTYEEVIKTFRPYLNDGGKVTKFQSTKG